MSPDWSRESEAAIMGIHWNDFDVGKNLKIGGFPRFRPIEGGQNTCLRVEGIGRKSPSKKQATRPLGGPSNIVAPPRDKYVPRCTAV